MRHFEEIEKSIIKVLIELDNQKSLNCLSNILQNYKIRFFDQEIKFYFSVQNNDQLSMETFDNISNATPDVLTTLLHYANKHMLIIIRLFKFLEDNGYIIYSDGGYGTQFSMGSIFVEQQSTSLGLISPAIVPDFIFWARQIFYTTPNLQKLVLNDFIEEEEKKYRDQLVLANTQAKIAMYGFAVTIVALIVSTYYQQKQLDDDSIKKVEITNKNSYLDVCMHDYRNELLYISK